MIPVRVPAGLKPVLATEDRRVIEPGHPLAAEFCQACYEPLAGSPAVLVFVGISPRDRKTTGWTAGSAVAVHEACAVGPT
jgi:hypothetical protein